MYSLVTTLPTGITTYQTFADEHELAMHLESIGVPYYGEVGYTVMAAGHVYEYGESGK